MLQNYLLIDFAQVENWKQKYLCFKIFSKINIQLLKTIYRNNSILVKN